MFVALNQNLLVWSTVIIGLHFNTSGHSNSISKWQKNSKEEELVKKSGVLACSCWSSLKGVL